MAANPYPNIGWNPVPGIPTEVTGLQKKVATAATALDTCHQQLQKLLGESSYWQGDAAEQFRKTLDGDLPKYLKEAATSLQTAASQLHNWDGHLASNRELAQKYDADIAEKRSAAEKAKGSYEQAAKHPDLTPAKQYPSQAEADAATARMRSAEQSLNEASVALTKANAEYEDIDRKIKTLETQHADQAETVAKALDGSTKKAPDEPGFWSKVGDVLKSVGEFLLEHAGTIGAIAGLLALFPTPLTPLFAGIAVVASAASMGKNLADPEFRSQLMGGGSGMDTFAAWASLAGDTVGMIPGGKALGMAAKEVTEGVADATRWGVAVSNSEKAGAFFKEIVPAFSKNATDDVADAWRAAGESAGGSAKLMGEITANGLNVGANLISSAESLGLVDKDGAEHNAAEGTKAAATAHSIAGLLGWA
ncbi:putative T7SS-secreted protein [Streptomyces cavernicola]|uniref:WXG100 family type VII secretion target n=1 Tax=Streptomyces cavernicola TaxID=3043613 RepID=A0ABT6SCC6_9ACTN|nr:hypothetical protein [Streptomyces sp. B-S-A6]MDI3405454.1 hypothetical protein [Streptomyces sp. B-S-A6]